MRCSRRPAFPSRTEPPLSVFSDKAATPPSTRRPTLAGQEPHGLSPGPTNSPQKHNTTVFLRKNIDWLFPEFWKNQLPSTNTDTFAQTQLSDFTIFSSGTLLVLSKASGCGKVGRRAHGLWNAFSGLRQCAAHPEQIESQSLAFDHPIWQKHRESLFDRSIKRGVGCPFSCWR